MLRVASNSLLRTSRGSKVSISLKTIDDLVFDYHVAKEEIGDCVRKFSASGAAPSLSIWRGRKKEMGKEGLIIVKELKRLKSNPVRLERFMETQVSRLLKLDLFAVLAEFQRQVQVFLSMKQAKRNKEDEKKKMLRLPEVIQVDIFLRVPVKCILRCRCLCKPLCRLLYNPKFIEDHLTRNKKNPSLMLISNEFNRTPDCCTIDYASILSASASALSTKCTCDGAIQKYNCRQSDWVSSFRIVGSCNGLICININGVMRFCILNPSSGEYRELALFPLRSSPSTLTFGFGYDCHLDVYKLVRILADGQGYWYSQVQVCTLLRENLPWKTIQTMHQYVFIPHGLTGHLSVWFLNGALHWKGFIEATSSWVIVSFDMSTDRFVDFPYPEEVNPPLRYSYNMMRVFDHLGILEDLICLVVYDVRNIHNCPLIDIWLMQDYGVSESWIKRYSLKPSCTIEYPLGKLVWFSTNGEVLILIDGGYNKLLYDPKNDSTKFLEVQALGWRTAGSKMVSYVDSLVSPWPRTTFVWERDANEVKTKKQRQK